LTPGEHMAKCIECRRPMHPTDASQWMICGRCAADERKRMPIARSIAEFSPETRGRTGRNPHALDPLLATEDQPDSMSWREYDDRRWNGVRF